MSLLNPLKLTHPELLPFAPVGRFWGRAESPGHRVQIATLYVTAAGEWVGAIAADQGYPLLQCGLVKKPIALKMFSQWWENHKESLGLLATTPDNFEFPALSADAERRALAPMLRGAVPETPSTLHVLYQLAAGRCLLAAKNRAPDVPSGDSLQDSWEWTQALVQAGSESVSLNWPTAPQWPSNTAYELLGLLLQLSVDRFPERHMDALVHLAGGNTEPLVQAIPEPWLQLFQQELDALMDSSWRLSGRHSPAPGTDDALGRQAVLATSIRRMTVADWLHGAIVPYAPRIRAWVSHPDFAQALASASIPF